MLTALTRSSKMDEQPKMEEKMQMKTEEKEKGKETKAEKKDLPKMGGPAVGSLVGLSIGALLAGGGMAAIRKGTS
jgi:hypothetical protein